MEALMLDGNAAAGLLSEIFAVEMTNAVGTCDHCGAAGEVGRVRLFRGAGLTLRCPTCDSVLMKIVVGETRVWLDLRGVRALELRP
jgi:Zn finger protein HypA/HybF involved in hydrogenase expression